MHLYFQRIILLKFKCMCLYELFLESAVLSKKLLLQYSTKFRRWRTFANLAKQMPFANILPSQIPNSLK